MQYLRRNWFLVIGIFFFSAIVAYRAWAIPITHDEASTWLNYRHINVWSCISNAACWGTANNHWLNTLLLQWSAFFFGEDAWALRLPNVIAGIAYLCGAALISTKYAKNPGIQIAGFLLLCCHAYLLDFFSLARSYGIVASGIIWGIYGMLCYIEKYDLRWLSISILALTVAILGNFTALLPWSALLLGWFLWLLLNKKYALLLKHGQLWLLNAVILYMMLRFPLKTLAGSGEFNWGASDPWTMSKDLMVNLLYGARYAEDFNSLYLLLVFIFFVVLIGILSLLVKRTSSRPPVIFITLLLLLNIIIILLQQKVTGALAPIGRKSIYLIPFIFGCFALGLGLLRNIKSQWLVSVILSLALTFHFVCVMPMKYCREWYYDAYYPQLFSTILPQGAASDSIRLGNTWIFSPALSFYQKTIPLPLDGLEQQRPLDIDTTMQYYYVEIQDTVGMSAKGFVMEKWIGSFLLFKNIR